MNFPPFQHVSQLQKKKKRERKVSFVSDYLVSLFFIHFLLTSSTVSWFSFYISSHLILSLCFATLPRTALRFEWDDKKINFDEENLFLSFSLRFQIFLPNLFCLRSESSSLSTQVEASLLLHTQVKFSIFKTIIMMEISQHMENNFSIMSISRWAVEWVLIMLITIDVCVHWSSFAREDKFRTFSSEREIWAKSQLDSMSTLTSIKNAVAELAHFSVCVWWGSDGWWWNFYQRNSSSCFSRLN